MNARSCTTLTAMLLAVAACGDVEINGPEPPEYPGPWGVRNTDFFAELPFHFDRARAGRTELHLIGVAGTVEILGTAPGSNIVVEGMRRVRSDSKADAQQHLADLRVEISETSSAVLVTTRQPQDHHGRRYEVDYTIRIPEDLNVAVQLVAGPLDVASIHGNVGVTHAAGDITLNDIEGSATVRLASGEISGSVTMPLNGTIDFAVTAGGIDLRIPHGTSASFRADASVGDVTLNNLPLEDRDPRTNVVSGTLAEGDGVIRLATVAGDITVTGM